MRILFDKNVPVGARRFLTKHEVRTVEEMNWPPQLENGELLAPIAHIANCAMYAPPRG